MTPSEPDILRVAARLARILGEDRCLLVGGMAVSGHGYVRATDDVDLIVRSLAEAHERLEAAGIAVKRTRGDVLEGDFPCLKGTLDGVPFDVMPPLVPLEWERAIEVPAGEGLRIQVVDLEGLLRLKLRAQGVQDLLDVAVLVLRHPDHREKAREIATANRVLARLDSFLADRRTQSAAADQADREQTTRQQARKARTPRRRPSKRKGGT